MYSSKFYSICFCLLSLSGCATMFNSGSQTIQAIPSNGEGVRVNITTPSGTYATKLPTTIVAEPSTFHKVLVDVKDDCYEPTQTAVPSTVTPSFIVNVLFWPGFIIDTLTGTMWKYNNTVSVNTVPKTGGCSKS